MAVHGLLEALSDDEARSVLAAARRRRFRRGEVIFHEGDPGDSLHMIEEGHVAIRVTTPLGDVATLNVLGPGDFFGELALVSGRARSGTAVPLDAVETLSLHRSQVDDLRESHVEIDWLLLEAVVLQVQRLSLQLVDALYIPAPKRVIRRLLDVARIYAADATGTLTIPLTQEEIAGLAGATRPTVNKCLRDLADRGIVAIERGQVELLDRDGLERAAR